MPAGGIAPLPLNLGNEEMNKELIPMKIGLIRSRRPLPAKRCLVEQTHAVLEGA